MELQDQHTTLVSGGGAVAVGPAGGAGGAGAAGAAGPAGPAGPAHHPGVCGRSRRCRTSRTSKTSRTSRFTSEILWTCEYLPLSQEPQRRTLVMKASVCPSVRNPLQQVGVVTLPESSLVRRDSLVQGVCRPATVSLNVVTLNQKLYWSSLCCQTRKLTLVSLPLPGFKTTNKLHNKYK